MATWCLHSEKDDNLIYKKWLKHTQSRLFASGVHPSNG